MRPMLPVLTLVTAQGAGALHLNFHLHQDKRQNFFSEIGSALGFGPTDTPTPPPSPTAAPTPPTTSLRGPGHRTTSSASTAASTSSSTDSQATTASSTITSSSSSSSASTSSSFSSASSTTLTSTSTSSTPSATSVPPPPAPSTNGPGISSGGVAVAVIMSLFVFAVIAFVIFKYEPHCKAWWAAREQRKFVERSYRAALDGPNAKGAGGLRSEALSTDSDMDSHNRGGKRYAYLTSFFAPRTARLGDGQEIRRKPVQWGRGRQEYSDIRDDDSPVGEKNGNMGMSMGEVRESLPLGRLTSPMGVGSRKSLKVKRKEKPLPTPSPNPEELERVSIALAMPASVAVAPELR